MATAYLRWRVRLQGTVRGNTDGMIAPFILGVMVRSIKDRSLPDVWHEYHHRLILPEHYAAVVGEDQRRPYVAPEFLGGLQDPLETEGKVCLNVYANHAYYQPVGKPPLFDPSGVVFAMRIYNLDEAIQRRNR